MDLNLKGKTAIVTGGTTGLGAGICDVLAEEGMNVIANYLFDPEGAEKFVKELSEKYGTKCVAMYGDISKAEDIDNIFVQAEEKYGHVDVLVNNAGIWPTTPIEKMSDDEWRKVVDIDLNGTFMFSKRAAIHYLKHDVKGNGVAPGMVRTPINEDKLSQPEWLKYYEDRIPVGRVSTAREVAYTVAFLASEKGMYIAGAIVDVTGGMLI